MNRRIIYICLLLVLVGNFAACGTTPPETTPAATTPVETTPAATTPVETTPVTTTPVATTPAVTTPVVTTPIVTTPAVTTPAVTTPAEPPRIFDADTVEGQMEDAGVPFPTDVAPVYTYINGMDEETTKDDPDLSMWYKQYLDGEGRVLYEERYDVMTDRVSDQKGYVYDEDGRVILTLVYTNRGLIRTEYDYETGDQPTEIRYYAYHGGLTNSTQFAYDAEGRVALRTEYNSEGILIEGQYSTYYEDGSPRRLVLIAYDSGIASGATVSVYDTDGNMQVTVYNSDGTGEPMPENIEDLFGNMDHNADETYDRLNFPTEEYIVSSLKTVPYVWEVVAVTEDNDPMGNLNKEGYYVSCVYFSCVFIDQSDVFGTTVIEKGVDCGGCIEVYRTEADAEKRDIYLSLFDGTILDPGMHVVLGSVVIRVSDEITLSSQNHLKNNIISALLGKATDDSDPYQNIIQSMEVDANKLFLSPLEAADKLVNEGYSLWESKYIINNCVVDWNKNAEVRLNNLLMNIDDADRTWAKEWLLNVDGFTVEQAEYAVLHCLYDWKAAALAYVTQSDPICPADIKYDLQSRGFTETEWDYAISNCDIDWNYKAEQMATNNYMSDGYSPSELSEYLQNIGGFTPQQAQVGVQRCDVDWINQVSSYISEKLDKWVAYSWCDDCGEIYGVYDSCPFCGNEINVQEAFGYTKAEVMLILEKEGFCKETIDKGLQVFEDSYFYDINNYKIVK